MTVMYRFGIEFRSFCCRYCGRHGGFYAGQVVDFDVFCSEACLDNFSRHGKRPRLLNSLDSSNG